ncbi:hypothetical protein [Methylobacterium pseudosasicola]|uniref:Uncharacterized protein n=1 Tax=Methylobacterium pseudosasicola TaxID=582667 RepID=A0A1I4H366_9HYPH|nr:hypothetical protein [Methylobacterium pseudosasicola]SFL36728.1 hypothetical protein SAMN05192568_10047 [Methylobacterium pseudosasicola]
MSIGKTMTRTAERAGATGGTARNAPDRRRVGGTARRRPVDPRSVARSSRAPARLRAGSIREFDDSELDPAFDEFGDLAEHVDGLAVHMRDVLAHHALAESGTDLD